MSSSSIGKYTPQAFYTENQASMQECLVNTKDTSDGCIDLNKALPVKQIFDKILAGCADKRDYVAYPNPKLVRYVDAKTAINCGSRKGNFYDYVTCEGNIGDSKVYYYYNLRQVSRHEQGAAPVWHEMLLRIGKDRSEREENRFQGNDTPKLGDKFANAVIHGPAQEPGMHPLTIVTLTALAAVTLYGIYKVASRCLNKEKKSID